MVIFIPYGEYDGKTNMERDENILEEALNTGGNPVLRLYGWKNPALSLGRNQSLEGINLDFCRENNIEIVKRPTGGRALLHDKELTYCFVISEKLLKNGSNIKSSYKEISSALIGAFAELGINLEFSQREKVYTKDDYCMKISTGADLCFKGKKIIGSAQVRRKGYILQHGSILFDIDREKIRGIFGQEFDEENTTCLREIKPAVCEINLLSNAIKEYFADLLQII